ncbi:MAG: response regulator transcription factor [Candidatus Nanogingivalaceae bacterium]|nr:MAG: response regulator transcription factor [Candidatus Nanogingivalaceae bacterium]QWB91301.1 MAG: response regulator transcription factor [Candidatus Nanogingivalaceae bacterium]
MRILIVEDERKIARALGRALKNEKYAVDISYDGTDAYAMAGMIDYDLLILDRMIPGDYDGLSLTKKLREEGKNVPILLLTALGATQDKTEGLDGGADDYLTKPFALDELLARVRALLRRPQTSVETVLRVADLSLDLNTHEVLRNNQKIELTNKEFSLLGYLVRNAGRPVSKEQIIAHVWDYDADILPNNIEVYISYLREKVDKPFKDKLIKTVRGLGYKIDEE